MHRCELADGFSIALGALPPEHTGGAAWFERLWALHPDRYHRINLHGRVVATPRWQQAYGRDYVYTGRTNRAIPLNPDMFGILDWCRATIHPMLNGLLLNWYDGSLGHYIGAHRDSEVGRIRGTPIVTISLGETRTFRFRRWKRFGKWDFATPHGSVIVIPWEVNEQFTHEVPKTRLAQGRRISITARAFM